MLWMSVDLAALSFNPDNRRTHWGILKEQIMCNNAAIKTCGCYSHSVEYPENAMLIINVNHIYFSICWRYTNPAMSLACFSFNQV